MWYTIVTWGHHDKLARGPWNTIEQAESAWKKFVNWCNETQGQSAKTMIGGSARLVSARTRQMARSASVGGHETEIVRHLTT